MMRRRAKWGRSALTPRRRSRAYRLRLVALRERECERMIEEARRA